MSPTETMPAPPNEARLRQLYTKMQRDDLEILRDSQKEVTDFVRLGRKWGFFALDTEASAKAGREVLRHNHMPESNLAALIGRISLRELDEIEKEIDNKLKDDPRYLARLLISRIGDLYLQESAGHGTTALTAGKAAEKLASEQDPAMYLRWVNTPAPMHSFPTWYQVMKMRGMGPVDLEMIYASMDRENKQRVSADADGISQTTRGAVDANGATHQ